MDPVTRDVIEWPALLEELARHAHSALGRFAVLSLEPAIDAQAVEKRLARTREMLQLLDAGKTLPLAGIDDLSPLLDQASVEGSALAPEDWPRLARCLEAIAALARFGADHAEQSPALAAIFARLHPNAALQQTIARIFDEDGVIRDQASPGLARIRSEIRRGEATVKRTVTRLLEKFRGGTVLQDDYTTIRNGRHVLPVRASARGRVPGILHGTSATGETLYIEPSEVVESANSVEIARYEEAQEIQRLMRELTAALRPALPELREDLGTLALVDGTHALARNAQQHAWHVPVTGVGGALRLFGAHHPMLHIRRPGQSVPIEVQLDPHDRVIVISGPNAGGKTTLMKTIALTAALVQSGSPAPLSPDSRVPVFAGFHADIGDQQDLDEGISTFSGHVRRIREILDHAGDQSLVILDELGTGTDPEEGGALAQALLEEFGQRARLTIATSHLGPVKKWAEDAGGARNASFSLDPATHRPTFRLRLDIPGASEALTIAENEGLPNWVLGRAKELVGEQKLAMGELLRRIEEREKDLAGALREARARAESLEAQERVAAARAEQLRAERREAREQEIRAREQAVRQTRDRIERLIAELPSEEQLKARKNALNAAREQAVTEHERIARDRALLTAADNEQRPEGLVPGKKVFVRAFNAWGEIVKLNPPKEKATVRVGSLNVEVDTRGLSDKEPPKPDPLAEIASAAGGEDSGARGKKKKRSRRLKKRLAEIEPSASSAPKSLSAATGGGRINVSRDYTPLELDLHGYRVEEALAELDKYLDRALLADYPHVRIVHGTGQGKLYRAVHEFLRGYPSVRRYRFATPDEGGGGATIVEF